MIFDVTTQVLILSKSFSFFLLSKAENVLQLMMQ